MRDGTSFPRPHSLGTAQLCFRGTPTASSELPACPLPTPRLGHLKPQVRTTSPPAFSCPHCSASLCPCQLASCFCFPGKLAQVKKRHRRAGGRCRAEGAAPSGQLPPAALQASFHRNLETSRLLCRTRGREQKVPTKRKCRVASPAQQGKTQLPTGERQGQAPAHLPQA